MNEITLTDNEQNELEKLTREAQRNTTEAQRFAIEAAKVLSVTQERLKDYKDRGFFKRCWYAVSGKTSELERANQAGLIKMQKFAWSYLAKLQEQNLIQARVIAVIRNNLKELQGEIAELSDQISVIVDKFDARLTDLEGTSALHDWLLHIKLNDSIDRNTKYICFLQIVFDCLSVMRKSHIGFEKANMRDDIDAALVEFGIDRDEVMTVDAFVSGLYDEVVKVGMERLKSIIDILVDGEVLPASYMLQNFTGTGCNALYGFENEMERNENVALQIEDENARNAIRLAAVKAVMTNGNAQFTFSELGREIVGACLIAEDFYRSEHGMDMGDMLGLNEPAADDGFDMGSILGNCAEIKRHSFLDDTPSEDEKRSYIESFALVFAAMGEFRDSEYLTALAKLFGCEESVECVKNVSAALRSNPRSVNGQVQNDLKVMNDDKRKYSWALDAFMMGCVDGEVHAKVKSGVKTVLSKAFRLPESGVEDYLSGVEALVTQKDAEAVKEAIARMGGKTPNWATVARFRGLELSGEVADGSVSVSSSGDVEVVGLHLEMAKKVPFLADDIEWIESFKGCWYVSESSNKRIWKSQDGFSWSEVNLPETKDGAGFRLKEVGGYLMFWCEYGNFYIYTKDGEKWEAVTFSDEIDRIRKNDFIYIEDLGKWILHAYTYESFTYEDGLIFKTTESSSYDKSVAYTAAEIAGPWEEDGNGTVIGELDRGHHIIKECPLCYSQNKLIVLTDMDVSYSFAHKYTGNYLRPCYAPLNAGKFEQSSIDTSMEFQSFMSRCGAHIVEVDGGLVLQGCYNATYYSQTGQSWRKVLDRTLSPKMVKIGKYYCSLAGSWCDDQRALVITTDGVDYKQIPIGQEPNKACFNGDRVFLVDERSDEGGMFVGKVEIKQV